MGQSRIETLLERAEASSNDSSVASASVVFLSENAAACGFEECRRRILDIREWEESSTPSSYKLFTADGQVVSDRRLAEGLFVRISIAVSGKHDWVRVESIDREPDELVITVRPTFDPTKNPQDPKMISHFFSPEATNNFCLQLDKSKVTMYVIGLDEHQNTEHADGLIERIRNVAASNFGSYLGVQGSVWREFCVNFLSRATGARPVE